MPLGSSKGGQGGRECTSRKPRVSKKRRMKEMMRARVSKMPRTWPFIIRSRYRCLYLVSCSQRRRRALSESFIDHSWLGPAFCLLYRTSFLGFFRLKQHTPGCGILLKHVYKHPKHGAINPHVTALL